MYQYNYNPFNKKIENLEGSDLLVLKNVYEGWYIDYKRQAITIEKFAKHISSFANQYGGWLFIGIKESKDMRAGSFDGILKEDVPKIMVELREAVGQYMNPSAYFETKIINGPVDEIGLPDGNSIIVIGIPEGVNTPYVHKYGRIYRRVADQSKPEYETDRFILDTLWQKKEKTIKKLIEFVENTPLLSDDERSNPRIYIYLLSDPTFVNDSVGLDFKLFERIMKSSKGMEEELHVSIILDNIYSASGGYIARQVFQNNPIYELLTFRWWNNGNARLTIPINLHYMGNPKPKYKYFNEFIRILESKGFKQAKIADFTSLLISVVSLVQKYVEIYDELAMRNKIRFAAKLTNMSKIVPFINSKEYLEMAKKNGIPLVEDNVLEIPIGLSDGNLMDFGFIEKKSNNTQFVNAAVESSLLILGIMNYIGIPIDLHIKDEYEDFFVSLFTGYNEIIRDTNK